MTRRTKKGSRPDDEGMQLRHLEPETSWQRLLFIAPHPDDETLSAGGLIQRVATLGSAVRIVFLTDGEQNPWAHSAMERKLCVGAVARDRYRNRRRVEAAEALQRLGLDASAATFLGYRDMGLAKSVPDRSSSLLEDLRQVVTRFSPGVVLLPSVTDLHPDHRAAGIVTRAALRASGSEALALCYTVHHLSSSKPAARLVFTLSPEELQRKKEAIEAYESQLLLSRKRFRDYAAPCEEFWPLAEDHPESTIREYARPLRRLFTIAQPIVFAARKGSLERESGLETRKGDVALAGGVIEGTPFTR